MVRYIVLKNLLHSLLFLLGDLSLVRLALDLVD